MMHYDYGYGRTERTRVIRQKMQQRRAEAALNQAKTESLQQAYPNKFTRQSTAKTKYSDEIPEELLHNLDKTRGNPDSPLVLVTDKGQLNHWIRIWCETSPVGKEVAIEWQLTAKAQEEKLRQQQLEREESDRLKKEATRLIRERQELYRLPPGTVVRVRMPQTLYDGCFGRTIGEMRWQWNKLQALVEIDPAPPDHPIRRRDPRHRPSHLRLMTEFLDAEMLQREHPEALG